MFAQIQGLGFLFNVFLFSAGAVGRLLLSVSRLKVLKLHVQQLLLRVLGLIVQSSLRQDV